MTGLPAVAIAADDLTGATDALAAFAARGWSCRVVFDATQLRPSRDGVAQGIDTASRASSLAATGREAIGRIARHLAGAETAFLKVDSLLRGHMASDLAALRQGWPRVVVAPAFPAHGRTFSGERALAVVADLADHGLEPVHVKLGCDAALLARGGLLVVEAEVDDDLRRAVTGQGPTLWVGSAGLAGVLAEPGGAASRPAVPPRELPVLTVVGSRTALARRQVQEALRGRDNLRHGDGLEATDGPGDLVVSLPADGGPDDVSLVRALARELRGLDDRFGALVLVGGDTAREVLAAFEVTELDVVGEIEPGTALSVDPAGRAIVTKSGSFGDDSALRRIHEHLA